MSHNLIQAKGVAWRFVGKILLASADEIAKWMLGRNFIPRSIPRGNLAVTPPVVGSASPSPFVKCTNRRYTINDLIARGGTLARAFANGCTNDPESGEDYKTVASSPLVPIEMFSSEVIEPLPLIPSARVTEEFLKLGIRNLRSAAEYIQQLPYGRNSDAADELIFLIELRGTCSTKHALVRRLALEQGFDIALMVGIYEMTGQNTPGVGDVLARYGLTTLPEAHCYICTAGQKINLTRAEGQRSAEPISRFLYEEVIEASQIPSYKVRLHKDFLSHWIRDGNCGQLTLTQIWRIREDCIAAIEKK